MVTTKLQGLDNFKKQLNYAVASALTKTAYDIRAETQARLPRWLKLKRDFIPRSVIVDKATKENLVARVGFLERVPLIGLMEKGGERKPHEAKVIAIPVRGKGKTSKYKGNNVFVKSIDGLLGIWKKSKRLGLSLLYSLKRRTKYKPNTIQFGYVANLIAKTRFNNNLKNSIENAIRTAKR